MRYYKLLKDYITPFFTIRAGVIKSDIEWTSKFYLAVDQTSEDLFSKSDWFEEVDLLKYPMMFYERFQKQIEYALKQQKDRFPLDKNCPEPKGKDKNNYSRYIDEFMRPQYISGEEEKIIKAIRNAKEDGIGAIRSIHFTPNGVFTRLW